MDPQTDKAPLQDQAWDYFALHAGQRLTTLNFYVILATALTAAGVASYQRDFQFPLLRLPASVLLSLFSFVFWRLDVRNREFINRAEEALRFFESGHRDSELEKMSEIPVEWLFCTEHQATLQRQKKERWHSRFLPRSYSHAFECLFLVFFVVGLLGSISAAPAIVCWLFGATWPLFKVG